MGAEGHPMSLQAGGDWQNWRDRNILAYFHYVLCMITLCSAQRFKAGRWVRTASLQTLSWMFGDPRNPGQRAQAVFSYVKRDLSILKTDPTVCTVHR